MDICQRFLQPFAVIHKWNRVICLRSILTLCKDMYNKPQKSIFVNILNFPFFCDLKILYLLV